MASPLDVLGAAAAILQFIDYGMKLVSKASEIHKSSQGLTKHAAEIQDMTIKFKSLNDDLIARYDGVSSVLSAGERSVEKIAKECDTVAVSLLDVVETLRVKDSRNIAKSLAKAFKTDRQQKEIDQHQKKLDSLRQLLNEQLLRLVSDQASEISTTLRQLDKRTDGLASGLHRLKAELLDAIEHANHTQVSASLTRIYIDGTTGLRRQAVLASLKFEEIRQRSERIEEPTDKTYDWIFNPSQNKGPPLHFTEWLRRGDGVYWINGKAGSGKSTLMKHICTHPRTARALQSWAGERRLLVASHYFWYLGTPIQRSHEGLLRSILYDVLSDYPEIVESVCSTRYRDDSMTPPAQHLPWTLSELRNSIMKLADPALSLGNQSMCFCLFIDGLDEYDGEHDKVVRLFRDISNAANIKICVSSRPWEIFQHSFADSVASGNALVLQEHTSPDIRKFIEHEVGDINTSGPGATEDLELIKSEIVRKAQGVFLWVVLVVRKELKHGLLYADNMALIRKRLEQVPTELGEYFKLIFDRIDPIYLQETARIFLTCMRAGEPLPINVVGLISHDEPGSVAINATADERYQWVDEELFEQVRKQVNGRCQDLLEVFPPTLSPSRSGDKSLPIYNIQFLHRSVADYLEQRHVYDILIERAGASYDPSTTLLAAYTFLIVKVTWHKKLPGYALPWSLDALRHTAGLKSTPLTKALIRKLDTFMDMNFDRPLNPRHWTNLAGTPDGNYPTSSDRNLFEHRERDFLGHMIELGATDHAIAVLDERPHLLSEKKGRPYLDYALRTSRTVRAWPNLRGCQPRVRLAEHLLSLGARATDRVWIYDGRTLWDLYLTYLYEIGEDTEESRAVAWMLVRRGGAAPFQPRPLQDRHDERMAFNGPGTMEGLLEAVFGTEVGAAMAEAVAENGRLAKDGAAKRNSAGWAAFLGGLWK